MKRIPDTVDTPDGPTYEGRLLDHADEPVVDQGAPFDIRTLISRRGVLGLVGLGLGTVTLAACASPSTASTTPTVAATGTATSTATTAATAAATTSTVAVPSAEIPEETAGPYPGDGSNGPEILTQSGVVRSDIRTSLDTGTSAQGVPMTLTLTLFDQANGDAPFEGAAVYAWHADWLGRYSMYSEGVESETYLRGVQVADANGQVTFTSFYPACYDGRWPHIHFEVYPSVDAITDASNAIATSQVAMPDASNQAVFAESLYDGSSANYANVSLATDGVFSDDLGVLETPTISGDVTNGYAVGLGVRIDTTTQAGGGTVSGGGPGGGGPGNGN